MLDKKFDEHIKALFQDRQVPLEPEHWSLFEEQLDSIIGEETSLIDDEVIEQLKNYKAAPVAGDWEVMAGLLDKAEAQTNEHFDNDIKESVDNYEAPYDRSSWPILEEKLTHAEMRRRKVFVAKILEVAAVLLFLFTLYNFYPEIKTKVFNPAHELKTERSLLTEQDHSNIANTGNQIASAFNTEQTSVNSNLSNIGNTQPLRTSENSILPNIGNTQPLGTSVNSNSSGVENSQLAGVSENSISDIFTDSENEESGHNIKKEEVSELLNDQVVSRAVEQSLADGNQKQELAHEVLTSENTIKLDPTTENIGQKKFYPGEAQLIVRDDRNIFASVDPINRLKGYLHVPLFQNEVHQKLYGHFTPPKIKNVQTRVGIHAGADVNILHFPEDNFFSAGNPISFKAQDLPAVGYGGGLSLGWYGHRFGFESGLHYSNKSFKPGRQLLIGESLENSKVDFQAVEIDLVSIPLSLSYKIKPSGTFRFYIVGGLDFNIIAQAHYDLKIQNNYPFPLSITQTASSLASNREAHRVKEHILDGATFNSKSFVTAHAGFGIEKYLNPELSIFMQPSYLYQIPIDRFSNNIGKHFKTLNIRIGTRMPLK